MTVEDLDVLCGQIVATPTGARPDHDPFCRWGGDAWAEVVRAAASATTGTAYDPVVHVCIEDYLVQALGEFALVTGLYDPPPTVDGVLLAAARSYAGAAPAFRSVVVCPSGYRI